MRTQFRQTFWRGAAFALLGAVAALAQTGPAAGAHGSPLFDRYTGLLPRAPHEEFFGARMQRTVTLLAESNPKRRWPVTILVYGQSITAALRQGRLEEALRQRFPHAALTVLNRSISGFSSSQLVRTIASDAYALDPDLVIFHDMGAEALEYERMIAGLRRQTTAEVMLVTDPMRADESLEAPLADATGSSAVRRLAAQYGCELADLHEELRAYLKAHGQQPSAILADSVHPNALGLELMQGVLLRHFRPNPLGATDWLRSVRTYEAKRLPDEGAADQILFTGETWRFAGRSALGASPASALKFTFTGNRVDCVLGAVRDGKAGTATVRIDGRDPATLRELWTHTTPSAAFGTDWQPAVRRVTHRTPLVAESWKIVFTHLSPDASKFTFEVYGSLTGFDGRGEFDGARYPFGEWGDILEDPGSGQYPDVFVSRSGRVVIDYRDFKIPWAQRYSKKACPEGFTATWEAIPLFTAALAGGGAGEAGQVRLVTLAKGLVNGTHTVEIIPNGDGMVAVESLIVHQPSLP